MGIARLLLKYKLISGYFFIIMAILICNGCNENMVKYDYFIKKPTAIKKADSIEINLGYTRASANWVKTSVMIEEDVIYVSGELTFKEISQILLIKLPDPKKDYQVFWIDGDGKKTEIKVQKQI